MSFSHTSFFMLPCQSVGVTYFTVTKRRRKKNRWHSLNIQNKSWVSITWKQKTNDAMKGCISITLTCIYIFPIWKSMGAVWLSALWLQEHKGTPPWQPQLCPPAEESPMWFASDFLANLQQNSSQTRGDAPTGPEYLAAWQGGVIDSRFGRAGVAPFGTVRREMELS